MNDFRTYNPVECISINYFCVFIMKFPNLQYVDFYSCICKQAHSLFTSHTTHSLTPHPPPQPRDETPPRSSSPVVRDPRKRRRERETSEEKETKKRRKEKPDEPEQAEKQVLLPLIQLVWCLNMCIHVDS